MQAAQAARTALDAFNSALSNLGNERSGLEAGLLDAQGDTTGAAALRRTTALAGLTAGLSPDQAAAVTAAYDYNAALQAQIDTLKAATAAADQLADTNKNWQDQLDVLTGKETDRSIALRDATDDSTRALMAQVYAQQDLAAVSNERKGLQDQLDTLTMSSVELHIKQRNALDESNRGLFDQITAIKLANEAMADFKAQMESIANVRKSVGSARQSVESQVAGFDAPAYFAAQQTILRAQFSSAPGTAQKVDIAGQLQQSITDGLSAQITALNVARDARVKALTDEATLVNDNAAKAKQVAQDMASALGSIATYAKGLRTGNLSTLSPEDKLAAAKSQYESLYAAAQGGDSKAAGQLTGASDSYLGLAKDYYASTSAYTGIFGQVESQLTQLGAQVSVYEAIAASTQGTYDLLAATAESDSLYQANLLTLQQTALDQFGALDLDLANYQMGMESRLDASYVVMTDIGIKTDDVGSRVTQSGSQVANAVNNSTSATQQNSALLLQVIALLQEVKSNTGATAAATTATASAATLEASA